MGAETSSTHLIFFITAMIIAGSIATIIYTNVGSIVNAAWEGSNTLSKQLKSDITIINDPKNISYDGSNYIFYVKNTGRSTLAYEYVTVLIDGIVVQDSNIQKTIIGGGSVWNPADVLELKVNTTLSSGDHRIRVVTENGVEDTLDFRI